MSLEQSDAEAAAVQKEGHPRVTLDDINANVAHEVSFTVAQAATALGISQHPAHEILTLCVITTKAGFTIVGKSAPADPANFDAPLGLKLAREDCIRQLWPLMGFALRERLAAEAHV